MTVKPFGRVEMSYCSFGGRTAADEVSVVATIRAAAANVRTVVAVIKPIIPSFA
jgi:hypothetical protein